MVTVPATLMSGVLEASALSAITAWVFASISAMAAAPATPTFAAPAPEMAVVDTRLPTPSSSPGLPNLMFRAVTTMLRMRSMATSAVRPYLAKSSSILPCASPVSRLSRNVGSVSISTKELTTELASAPKTALEVSTVSSLNCAASRSMIIASSAAASLASIAS